MEQFWLCFVPLFFAMDGMGGLSLFVGLVGSAPRPVVRRIIVQSVFTAGVVGLAFLLIGRPILDLLKITSEDIMVAGGVLLLVLSIADMVASGRSPVRGDAETLGAVPLGVPLIVGPAVLTTLVLLVDRHGRTLTALALVLNVVIVGVIFWLSRPIYRLLGKPGAKTVSKLASLLLAAYAVMMIRQGILAIIVLAGKPPG